MKRPTVPEFLAGGDFRHLEGVLDESPPWLLAQLIRILSANVRIDNDVVRTIKDTAQSGPVVYAMKYRSLYDLHFLRMRFAELGLPLPAFVFETSVSRTGSLAKFFRVWRARLSRVMEYRRLPDPVDAKALEKILVAGGAAVLFLVDEKTSRSRYVHPESDPIRILLDLQGRIAGSITLLPMVTGGSMSSTARTVNILVILPLLVVPLMVWGSAYGQDYLDYYEQGEFALRVEKWDSAIDLFTKSLQDNPKFFVAYHNRAIAYSKRGEYDKSIEDLKKAVALNPDYPDAYGLMGLVYEIKKDYASALKVYREALTRERRPVVQQTIQQYIQDVEAKLKQNSTK